MDFSLSQEQQLLQDSVSRFVADQCGVERHRELSGSELGYEPAAWQQFADLGWLAMPFPEELGGIGGSAVDVMVISEALGRGLSREPFLYTVVCCGGFLRRTSARQQSAFIPGIVDGSRQWAFACVEQGAGYALDAVACSAHSEDDGYRLNGEKITVLNGHCADYLLVTARSSGEYRDASGISLFIVDTSLPGVSVEPFTALDGGRGANIRLQDVAVGEDCLLGPPGQALSLVQQVLDETILAMPIVAKHLYHSY